MAPARQLAPADRRPWPVVLAVALGLAATLVAFAGVRQGGRDRVRLHFDRTAANLEKSARQVVQAELDVLYDLRDAIDATGTLSRRAWSTFGRAQLARHRGIRALEWVPVVPAEDRPGFEAAARRDGLAGFRFTERDGQNRLVPAAPRAVYYPIFYVEPMAGNEAALGFTPVMATRDAAISRARETGRAAASQAFPIVQANDEALGVALFVPVYDPPGHLQGLVEGVFQPELTLAPLQAEAQALGVAVSLVDQSAPAGARVLLAAPAPPDALRRTATIDLDTRHWTLTFALADDRELGGPPELEWLVLVVGLAGTTALGAAIRGLLARRAAAEDLAAERAGALEQARVLDRMKTNFVNGVAHDLRSPLTTILGYAEFLEDDVPAEQRRFVTQIMRAARRLERMMDDLLDLARVDAGLFQLKLARTDLAALLAGVAEGVQPLVAEAGVTLALQPAATSLPVALDAARIERVLFNLVHNAIKFTPDGGTIRLSARREGDRVRFEVQDTGPGIPPDQRAQVFKRFTQLDGGAAKGGAGLGLSIAKAIVDAHGGAIGVESEPGRGATFWFELPGPPAGA